MKASQLTWGNGDYGFRASMSLRHVPDNLSVKLGSGHSGDVEYDCDDWLFPKDLYALVPYAEIDDLESVVTNRAVNTYESR